MNQQNKKISLLLIFKNEEENLKQNWSWVGECPQINQIVAIDDYSTDNSVKFIKKLATKKLKVNVYQRHLNDNFADQRIFGLSKTKNDWIFWLDADEKPSPQLINFLKTANLDQKAYCFPRQDFFLGRQLKYGETANLSFVRLFNKNYGLFENPVHETWVCRQPVIQTNFPILHYSHPNLESFLKKINYYSTIRAQDLVKHGHTSSLPSIILYPTAKFIQNYFLRFGFMDKMPGLILALGMSLHSFLVRAKLWHLQQS